MRRRIIPLLCFLLCSLMGLAGLWMAAYPDPRFPGTDWVTPVLCLGVALIVSGPAFAKTGDAALDDRAVEFRADRLALLRMGLGGAILGGLITVGATQAVTNISVNLANAAPARLLAAGLINAVLAPLLAIAVIYFAVLNLLDAARAAPAIRMDADQVFDRSSMSNATPWSAVDRIEVTSDGLMLIGPNLKRFRRATLSAIFRRLKSDQIFVYADPLTTTPMALAAAADRISPLNPRPSSAPR